MDCIEKLLKVKNFFFWLLLLSPVFGLAQMGNNDCISAFYIDDTDKYCSGPQSFSNLGATPSGITLPSCWEGSNDRDVWYVFSPENTGIFFQIFGSDPTTRESLGSFSFAIYEGRCNRLNEIICARSSRNINIIERTLSELVIGGLYYIRISTDAANQGTFEICLEGFNSVPDPTQDCPQAVVLCDKSTFVVDFLQGGGNDVNEARGSCLEGIDPAQPTETSSAWYKWTADRSGTLTFVLTPNNTKDPEEDLDFAVYRLPGGINDCRNKQLLRCMASGESLGNSPAQNAPCFGPTGLRTSSNDEQELPGCSPGDDNFVAAINMVAGESYALIVNNYSRSGFGFTIEFGGTGTFQGPQPDFRITADNGQECDQTIFFDDETFSLPGDDIMKYHWSFGEGATPQSADGNQRQAVVYNSFGIKRVALTVTTARGCQVTEILDVEIQSCCSVTNDLMVEAESTDLSCFESMDGTLEISATGGSPDYLYSFNGGRFQPSTNINNLQANTYDVTAQDSKGCENTAQVIINQPEELTLILTGPTDSVELGKTAQFMSVSGPDDRMFTYEWSPPIGIDCVDCPDTEVTSRGSRTYTLTITDQDGCSTSASINLLSILIRNFYAPNILSVSSPNGNNQFKIFTNQAAEIIESVSIFDRWGSEIYNIENVVYDEFIDGWDGSINGREVNPGPYAWVANIRYVDGVVITYNGTITVIK